MTGERYLLRGCIPPCTCYSQPPDLSTLKSSPQASSSKGLRFASSQESDQPIHTNKRGGDVNVLIDIFLKIIPIFLLANIV